MSTAIRLNQILGSHRNYANGDTFHRSIHSMISGSVVIPSSFTRGLAHFHIQTGIYQYVSTQFANSRQLDFRN